MDCTHADLQEAADHVERFCSRFFWNKPGAKLLVLRGNPGSGKSHIARAVSAWARGIGFAAFENGGWTKTPSSSVVYWPHISDGFRSGRFDVLEDIIAADWSVLDDIGAEYDPSKLSCDKLCQVLSRREDKFTIVTTNVTPDAWEEKFDPRIADRLLRECIICDLTNVPSYAVWKRMQ